MVTGTYIGITTVGIFIYWYCYYDWSEYNHQLVPLSQLRNWSECKLWPDFKVRNFAEFNFDSDPCNYFDWGSERPSTLSLTTLVLIEMFNAINALSEEKSLLQTGLFLNPLLIIACCMSFGLHLVILYVPFFRDIFGTSPMTKNDWILCVGLSFPVILIDEVVKIWCRARTRARMAEREARLDADMKKD